MNTSVYTEDISPDTRVIDMNVAQLRRFIFAAVFEALTPTDNEPADSLPEYGKGYQCIMQWFGISKSTAQKWKSDFLQPAIIQYMKGGAFLVDKKKAFELVKENVK